MEDFDFQAGGVGLLTEEVVSRYPGETVALIKRLCDELDDLWKVMALVESFDLGEDNSLEMLGGSLTIGEALSECERHREADKEECALLRRVLGKHLNKVSLADGAD